MPHVRGSSRRAKVASLALLAGALASTAFAVVRVTAARAGAACGAAAASTVGAVDATVAADVYRNELAGTELTADRARVIGAGDLVSAVASGNRTATRRAVSRLVFHPHWHIVRLRALDAKGHVLADVGGPYVVAPVAGLLRSGSRVVGSFVMSVQDDAGVAKLESRFVGDPIGFYAHGRLVVGVGASLPASLPTSPTVTLGGVHFQPLTQRFRAFPSGTVSAVIFVAPPPRSLSLESCATIRAREFGRVAARLARLARALPTHYYGYAVTVRTFTGAEVFVRSGTRQLASSGGAGPRLLPVSGSVTYRGTSWLVSSLALAPSTRAFLLVPPA